MPVPMTRLDKNDPKYKDHESKFYQSWRHPGKSAKIKSIFFVRNFDMGRSYRGKRFNTYLNGGSYRRMYHGTQRACRIGSKGNTLTLCDNDSCFLCGVLRHSFKLNKAYNKGMFGAGIYSTPTSSKADIYAKNHHLFSRTHAVLICHVVAKNPERRMAADNTITAPKPGYDCIEGVTQANGGGLLYPEFVVYREDAIIPVGLILYTRKGWTPLG
ncbi:uncharacterized protein B0J16DRAFT_180513 [Fusarium flagelliforme]|uniref:uncharacterized protein n=1 Tax=Fusarium flagelliforme TaxID=2675880 RepID=UPI001E8CC84A|nr:uncharacterized protein B0J16DRAFT_180513 [Fusarium flagelliforme]KAH7174203.1 hypothetical protein B0J16DRAFT_180513 [Fusarium flagelliforme]